MLWRSSFSKPLFHFRDPFDDSFFFPMWDRPRALLKTQNNLTSDPMDTFNSFFNENQIAEHERPFFEKHYPEKVAKQFNPYEVLGVTKNSTLEQIKKSYREKALKCHPREDSTPQGRKRFEQLGKAYQMLVNHRYINDYKDNSIHDFFGDFQKSIRDSFKESQMVEEKDEKKNDQLWKNADFYSESTYVQAKNGKDKKVLIEREYKKDGKGKKVRRQEKYLPDGTKEVTEEIDEGNGPQKKHFIENSQKKIAN